MIKVLNFEELNDVVNIDRDSKPTTVVRDFNTFLSWLDQRKI